MEHIKLLGKSNKGKKWSEERKIKWSVKMKALRQKKPELWMKNKLSSVSAKRIKGLISGVRYYSV